MKTTKIALVILAIAAVLYILLPSLSWAEDATALSKARWSGFYCTRIPVGLGELAQEPGSNLGVKTVRQSKLDAAPGRVDKP